MKYYGKHTKLLLSMGFETDSVGNVEIDDSGIGKLITILAKMHGDISGLEYQLKNYNNILDKLHHYEEVLSGDFTEEQRAKFGYRAG